MCVRTVGNLALKHIWKVFIQTKFESLSFEKANEESLTENRKAEVEIRDSMLKWKHWPDNEAQILAKERPKETIEIETETTTRVESKVNPNQECLKCGNFRKCRSDMFTTKR